MASQNQNLTLADIYILFYPLEPNYKHSKRMFLSSFLTIRILYIESFIWIQGENYVTSFLSINFKLAWFVVCLLIINFLNDISLCSFSGEHVGKLANKYSSNLHLNPQLDMGLDACVKHVQLLNRTECQHWKVKLVTLGSHGEDPFH